MRVAFYASAFDNVPEQQDLAWSQLVECLTAFRVSSKTLCAFNPCTGRDAKGRVCAGKNGAAWSPVEIEGTRLNENVRAVTVGVFDIDHAPDDSWFARLEVSGVEFVIHSTHQYPLEERFRVVVPLSRKVSPDEWHHVHAAMMSTLGLPADPLKDLSRIYFLPNHVEGSKPFSHHQTGVPLNVDAISRPTPATAVRQSVAEHVSTAPEPVDVNELAASIRKHASDVNRPLVTRALRGEGLGPRASANEYGGQDSALQALMSTAAFTAPDSVPWEAIEHLFRPCFAATDWGEGTDALVAVAKDKFERARARKQVRDEKRAAENDAMWEAAGIIRGQKPKTETPLDESATDDPDRWTEKLIYTKEKEPKLAVCEANVLRVLRNAPEWKNAIRFNLVSKKLELQNAPDDIQAIDALDVTISVWFQESAWGKLGLNPTPRMVGEALRAIPERMSFDPLLEYLEGLRWDGTKRIDTFLERYFGAHGDPVEYLRAISRRWLISLVARGMRPGTKVDTVLCLEGSQGLGKSTALRILTDPWFCDTKLDINSKDSWSLASQFWMMELAEAEGMTRVQAEALKGFFSKRDDTYRPPYGRTNATTLRRTLFAVTTNAQRFLRFDPTGYRRYWPVTCGALDLAAMKQDRDQLLAEAVVAHRAGELWYFFPNTVEGQLAEAAARKREETIGEASQEFISGWLLSLDPSKPPEQGGRPRNVKISELLTHPNVFGLQRHQITRQREMEIAEVLRAMGFEKHRGWNGSEWKTPEVILEAAQVTPIRGTSPQTAPASAEAAF